MMWVGARPKKVLGNDQFWTGGTFSVQLWKEAADQAEHTAYPTESREEDSIERGPVDDPTCGLEQPFDGTRF